MLNVNILTHHVFLFIASTQYQVRALHVSQRVSALRLLCGRKRLLHRKVFDPDSEPNTTQ